jgi:murein DD-endopeptidase MepM/ murein hydrolase activator NlpD
LPVAVLVGRLAAVVLLTTGLLVTVLLAVVGDADPAGAQGSRAFGAEAIVASDPTVRSDRVGNGSVRAPAQVPSGPWVVPVEVAVLDPFRPPTSEWGPGNRGWELATEGGEVVLAPGPGIVSFAGRVAGRGVVSIDHGGGLLSSLTGMSTITVRAGEPVAVGTPVGTAAAGLHVGFRLHGRYLDPAELFGRRLRAVLVPVPP